jgi:hypothetical protein
MGVDAHLAPDIFGAGLLDVKLLSQACLDMEPLKTPW